MADSSTGTPATVFWFRFSPPARLVRFSAEIVAASEVQYHEVMLNKAEQLTKKFLAINPKHQVPALKVGDTCMAESRFLVRHLFNTYNKDPINDHWYPSDPETRKKVDEWMDWSKQIHSLVEMGCIGYVTVQPGMGWRESVGCMGAILHKNACKESTIQKIKQQLDEAEALTAGRNLNEVSDLNFGDLTTFEEVLQIMEIHPRFSWDEFPNLSKMNDLMRQAPGFDVVHQPFFEFLDEWRRLQKEGARPKNCCRDFCLGARTIAIFIGSAIKMKCGCAKRAKGQSAKDTPDAAARV